MKLTSEQIAYIENYIARFDIKYYEVYMEILDHLILGVEAIMEHDKTISIEDAVVKAKVEGFGKMSLREIEEERVLLINKKQRKEYGNHLKTYFTFPYFALTTIIFLSAYFSLNFFTQPHKFQLIISIPTILFCLIDWKRKHLKFGTKNTLKVLKMQNFGYLTSLVMIWMNLSYVYEIFGLKNLNSSIGYKIYISILVTLSFLSFLFYLKASKKVTVELQQQIFA